MIEFMGRFFIYIISCGVSYYVVKSIYDHNGYEFKLGGSQFWLGAIFILIIQMSYKISHIGG